MWVTSRRENEDSTSSVTRTMSSPMRSLGVCPRCECSVPATNLLIAYERNGTTATYAECSDCQEVVRPA